MEQYEFDGVIIRRMEDNLINVPLDHSAFDWHQDKASVLLAFEAIMTVVSDKFGQREDLIEHTQGVLFGHVQVKWEGVNSCGKTGCLLVSIGLHSVILYPI